VILFPGGTGNPMNVKSSMEKEKRLTDEYLPKDADKTTIQKFKEIQDETLKALKAAMEKRNAAWESMESFVRGNVDTANKKAENVNKDNAAKKDAAWEAKESADNKYIISIVIGVTAGGVIGVGKTLLVEGAKTAASKLFIIASDAVAGGFVGFLVDWAYVSTLEQNKQAYFDNIELLNENTDLQQKIYNLTKENIRLLAKEYYDKLQSDYRKERGKIWDEFFRKRKELCSEDDKKAIKSSNDSVPTEPFFDRPPMELP
jgi:hypothetical protein